MDRREDGYHEIETVFQEIELADSLELELTRKALGLCCDPPELANDSNLCLRAARLLREATGSANGVKVTLRKRIPWGAGLGGGSSDAATTLMALNHLWKLDMDDGALAALACQLGADVPFFLLGGCAVGQGIGEKLRRVPARADYWVVLVKPPIHISTHKVYRNLDLPDRGRIRTAEPLLKALRSGSIAELGSELYNAFESQVDAAHPEIGQIKRRMRDHGAQGTLMTGSGSCVFGIFADRVEALQTSQVFADIDGCLSWVTRPVVRTVPRKVSGAQVMSANHRKRGERLCPSA